MLDLLGPTIIAVTEIPLFPFLSFRAKLGNNLEIEPKLIKINHRAMITFES